MPTYGIRKVFGLRSANNLRNLRQHHLKDFSVFFLPYLGGGRVSGRDVADDGGQVLGPEGALPLPVVVVV